MKRLWSDEAKAYMLEYASELNLFALMDGLAAIEGFARTRSAVSGMRNKMGLSTRLNKYWTAEDEKFLRTRHGLLSDEAIGVALNRTETAVRNKRRTLRLVQDRTTKKTTTPGCYVTNWQDITEQWRCDFIDKVCADLARDGIKHEVRQREGDDNVQSAVWREPSVDAIPERSETWRHTYGK